VIIVGAQDGQKHAQQVEAQDASGEARQEHGARPRQTEPTRRARPSGTGGLCHEGSRHSDRCKPTGW